MSSNNNRIDDPIDADEYLTQWVTDLNGSALQKNNKKGQEGKSEGIVTQNGDYTTHQYNENGDLSDVIQGSHKKYADSYTESLSKGIDSYADNRYHKSLNGVMEEHAGHVLHAVDGAHVLSSSGTHMAFSTGGDKIEVIEGNRVHINNADEGRADHHAIGGHSISSDAEIRVSSDQDLIVQVGTNEGHIVNSNLSFDALGSAYINTKGQLNLAGLPLVSIAAGAPFQIGGIGSAAAAPSSIIMTPASIIFKVGATVMTMTPAGINIVTPSFLVEAGATIGLTSAGTAVVAGASVAELISAGATIIQGATIDLIP